MPPTIDVADFDAAVAQAVADALDARDAAAREAAEKAQAEAEEQERLARDADAQRLAAEAAEARRWEGHTHKWSKPDAQGMCSCSGEVDGDTCPLVLPAEIVKG